MSKTNKHNRKYTKFTTPIGLSGFANTVRESKFGGFSLDLFFDSSKEETSEFFSQLQQAHGANLKHESDANGFTGTDGGFGSTDVRDKDPEIFKEGSFMKLRLKSRTVPRLYDSEGKQIVLGHELPVGSEVRANVVAASYNYMGKAGTSLYLDSVQIIDMPEREKGSETTYAEFAPVEGGFIGLEADPTLNH